MTAGNVNDCDVACKLLDNFNLKGKTVIGDRGYFCNVETYGAESCISPKSNFKLFWDYDRGKYKCRNRIERFFGHLKEKRRIATRFDKIASRFFFMAVVIQHTLVFSKNFFSCKVCKINHQNQNCAD